MKRVLILVEGQTEERFVKDVLAHHLNEHGIHPIPTILTIKRVKSGSDFKGGVTSYTTVRREILRLLDDSEAAHVTTMFDYYGLPDDFPGVGNVHGTSFDKVRQIENALNANIDNRRFAAYLSLHEFESLLFSDPSQIARSLNDESKDEGLLEIRGQFPTPEDINDDPRTAPSKRIKTIFPRYGKVFYGSLIARRIGLTRIRAECPHFSEWVKRLEGL